MTCFKFWGCWVGLRRVHATDVPTGSLLGVRECSSTRFSASLLGASVCPKERIKEPSCKRATAGGSNRPPMEQPANPTPHPLDCSHRYRPESHGSILAGAGRSVERTPPDWHLTSGFAKVGGAEQKRFRVDRKPPPSMLRANHNALTQEERIMPHVCSFHVPLLRSV